MNGPPARTPSLGAVALMTGLGGFAGLALAHAVLALRRAWRPDGVLVVLIVFAGQALAWWWVRSHDRPVRPAALRLARQHPLMASWMAAELALVVAMWMPAGTNESWTLLAAYAKARGGLLALGALALSRSRAGRPLAATVARRLLVGAALAAPALGAFLGARPLWQSACAGGVLSVAAAAVSGAPGGFRDTWLGLAGVLAWPAAALALAALALGGGALPIAEPIALSSLLLSLGLASTVVWAARASGSG